MWKLFTILYLLYGEDCVNCLTCYCQDEDLSIEANTRDSVQTMGHTGYSSPQPTASCWPGHTPGATQCEAESVNDSRVNLPGSTTCPNVPSTNLCYSPEFLSGSPDSPAPQAPAVKQLAHPVVDVEVSHC